MPTQKSAQKWCCDLSRLLAWKITKGIHSCKPALLNRPVQEICLLNTDFHKYTHAHTHTEIPSATATSRDGFVLICVAVPIADH